MVKGGGKRKGASFERLICRDLSLWVSHGKQEDVFWRSAMSGGRSTVAAKKGKRLSSQAGDISCIHHVGAKFATLFFVECKHYSSLDLGGVFNLKGTLVNFWKTADAEGFKYGKMPLLFAKQNRVPTLVFLTSDAFFALSIPFSSALVHVPPLRCYAITADTFFTVARPPT